MKISICSQVKNRRRQLEITIGANLKSMQKDPSLEWVIVDMGSEDGLEELIRDNMREGIEYYRCLDDMPYSIPVAKNFAARLSSGGYLFNLDIDNYICDVGSQIREVNYEGVLCEVWFKGVFGRIGCTREIFQRAGGYDESFLPAAQHEIDFINRCRLLGCNFHDIRPGFMAVANDKSETTINMPGRPSWEKMNQENKIKTQRNADEGVANPNASHARARFVHNFSEVVELGETF